MDDFDSYSFFDLQGKKNEEGRTTKVLTHSQEIAQKEKELKALDEFVNVLSREAREYLIYRLQYTPHSSSRRVPYSLIKNSDIQKHLRYTLMLTASLISKGDPSNLLIETVEDLQIARSMSIEDPYSSKNLRKRRRQTNTTSKEDLASRLLNNLSIAYKQNCKKRAEKKRILSVAAGEITYSEGKRLFECGPVQFSEAKKHYTQFGPFAETNANSCSALNIVENFRKRFQHVDENVAWEEFCVAQKEVAESIGKEAFIRKIRGTPQESSIDSVDDVFAESPEALSFMNNE
jgi:hypothetical protein